MLKNQKTRVTLFTLLSLSGMAFLTFAHAGGDEYDNSYAAGKEPKGLTGQREADYYHLTEGADVYPYEWAIHLKSARFKINKQPAPFVQNLDKRFGMIKTENNGDYIPEYIGLSTGWTNSTPDQMDAHTADKAILKRDGLNGAVSTKVMGTTCSLCHNGGVNLGGKFYQIQGAPNRTDSMAYFDDLARSTLKLLSNKKLMTDFLKEFGIPNPEQEAKKQVNFFLAQLGHDAHTIDAGKISGLITLALAQAKDLNRLHHCRHSVGESLIRLYRLTYQIPDNQPIGDMQTRLEYLAAQFTGDSPKLIGRMTGPGRFDAFARLTNGVLKKEVINLDAPVREPYVWGLKHTAMLHYNSNTNSVLMRNIGEAVALGAPVMGDSGDSGVNLRNLDRIERLIYDIKVPEWNKIFADRPDLRVSEHRAARGKQIYEAKCMTCHTIARKVGPTHQMNEYKLFTQAEIGTDPNQANNVSPWGEELNQALRKLTLSVRGKYYEANHVPAKVQSYMGFTDIRGEEFFRWTANGEFVQQQQYHNNFGNVEKGYTYRARYLAGIWAAAPFLHNGSVPTLLDLLSPSSERPKYFNHSSYNFDPKRVGYEYERPNVGQGNLSIIKDLLHRSSHYVGPAPCQASEPSCFDTTLSGNSNAGHEGPQFGTDLPLSDKLDLIEYLKVLPPEPEYAW